MAEDWAYQKRGGESARGAVVDFTDALPACVFCGAAGYFQAFPDGMMTVHWRCDHELAQADEEARDDADARNDALHEAICGYLVAEGMASDLAHRLALRVAQLVMAMAQEDGRRWRGGQAKVRDIASCRPSFLELLAALRWDWISRGTRRRCR